MINTMNIMTGYVVLRGTWQMRFPMFIVMWIFMPSFEVEDADEFEGKRFWYALAMTMHILLAILHLLSFSAILPKNWLLYIEGLKIMSILVEVINFIIALTLFSKQPPYNMLLDKESEKAPDYDA